MLKIGLTGGVGAGKSRVLSWLEAEQGAAVIRTDEVARQIMEPGEKGYVRVVETFGRAVLDKEGKIDRPALAGIIFQNKEARNIVNSITHPLVWESVQKEIAALEALAKAEEKKQTETKKQGSLVVVESALFDKTSTAFFNEIWYVYASEEVRIRRLMETRGYSRKRCISMIASQPSDQEFRKFSSKVIDNSGDWRETENILKAEFHLLNTFFLFSY